jgi:hypothetical protein
VNAPVDAALEWAVATGPPNWLFVVALLTRPSTWTSTVVDAARSRLGGGDE